MVVENLKDLDFIKKIYEETPRSLVLFVGDFSQASKTLEYYMNKLPENMLGGFKLFVCDVDVSLTVKKNENINIIPSFKAYVDGKIVKTVEEMMTPSEIVEMLSEISNSYSKK